MLTVAPDIDHHPTLPDRRRLAGSRRPDPGPGPDRGLPTTARREARSGNTVTTTTLSMTIGAPVGTSRGTTPEMMTTRAIAIVPAATGAMWTTTETMSLMAISGTRTATRTTAETSAGGPAAGRRRIGKCASPSGTMS